MFLLFRGHEPAALALFDAAGEAAAQEKAKEHRLQRYVAARAKGTLPGGHGKVRGNGRTALSYQGASFAPAGPIDCFFRV